MPRAFGRKSARSSGPPSFTWEPEGRRRPGRFVALVALTLTLGGLGYGAAQVADYLRTPANRAVAVAPAALESDGTAANGSDASAAVAVRPPEPHPANSASKEPPVSSEGSSSPSRPEAPAPTPAPPAKNETAADQSTSTVAVLNAGTPEAEAEAETRPGAQAKAAEEKVSRSPPRSRTATARIRKQRYERRLASRQQRAREVREAVLPWRFAPAVRADAGSLRREDGRGPVPFAPRYYGYAEMPY